MSTRERVKAGPRAVTAIVPDVTSRRSARSRISVIIVEVFPEVIQLYSYRYRDDPCYSAAFRTTNVEEARAASYLHARVLATAPAYHALHRRHEILSAVLESRNRRWV